MYFMYIVYCCVCVGGGEKPQSTVDKFSQLEHSRWHEKSIKERMRDHKKTLKMSNCNRTSIYLLGNECRVFYMVLIKFTLPPYNVTVGRRLSFGPEFFP